MHLTNNCRPVPGRHQFVYTVYHEKYSPVESSMNTGPRAASPQRLNEGVVFTLQDHGPTKTPDQTKYQHSNEGPDYV